MNEESYTDDADVSQLEQRIDELEATIRQMLPSRREAIGMGVAGLAGASLMSGTASAGSAQVGTIGDNSNLVDLVAEDVTITDTLNTASISGAAAGEALLSDGSGNLTFGSGGGGILRNGSEIDYVALDVSNLPASTASGDVALVTASDQYVKDNPPSGTPFDITSSQFAFDTDIGTQDSSPTGIAWNDDGSRLYEVGAGSARIYQYTVSTPFDITTASFSTDIASQDSNPQGIAWNDDGSRLYEVGDSSDRIYQYTVSTPFDITTASFSTDIATQDSFPRGIAWNDDGSRLYESGGDNIYQYTVSSPFDIATASFDTSIKTNNNEADARGLAFSNDGTQMVVLIISPDIIQQYDLATGGWEAF